MATMKDDKVGFGQRHVQMVMMFFGIATAYMCRVTLSVCLVSMTAVENSHGYEVFPWTQVQRGVVLSSFFWGYTLSQVPAGFVAQRFGPKLCLLVGVGGSGLVAMLMPLGSRWGGWQALCGLRTVQGLVQGIVFPSTHCMMGRWVPPLERGRGSVAVYSGTSLATVSMMAGAGALSASPLGWPSGFYTPGVIAVLWAVAWLFLGADSPESCSRISRRERDYIKRTLGDTSSGEKRLPVPLCAIVTSVPVLSILASNCAQSFGHWTMLTQIPNFMTEVLHFDIKKNGLFSALPYVGLLCTSLFVAWLSQFLNERNIMSVGASRKVFNSIGQWGGATVLLVLGLCRVTPMVAVALLVGVVSLECGVLAGYVVNYVDLSPNFSGVLLGIGNGVAHIMAIAAPIVMSWVVGDTRDLPQEEVESRWSKAYFITASIFFTGNLLFVVFGSARVQPWNNPTESKPPACTTPDQREVAELLLVKSEDNK